MAKPADDRIPFTLRLPPALHQRLLAAAGSDKSLNAEILTRLVQSFDSVPEKLAELEDVVEYQGRRIEELEERLSDVMYTLGKWDPNDRRR